MTDAADKKRRLRAEALRRREAAAARLGPCPETATARLLAEIGSATPAVLGAYRAARHELDPGEAFEALTLRGAVGAMPCARRGEPLTFRRWSPGDTLRTTAFGVDEPTSGEPVEPDLLIVPLLAFDRRGFRLGYGGGHYDRTLAAFRAAGRGVRAIGFAYAAQETATLPAEPWDVPLDLIVTEAETVRPEGAP